MGNREYPFEESSMCDSCGNLGAYDIMGDYVCARCLECEIDGRKVEESLKNRGLFFVTNRRTFGLYKNDVGNLLCRLTAKEEQNKDFIKREKLIYARMGVLDNAIESIQIALSVSDYDPEAALEKIAEIIRGVNKDQ